MLLRHRVLLSALAATVVAANLLQSFTAIVVYAGDDGPSAVSNRREVTEFVAMPDEIVDLAAGLDAVGSAAWRFGFAGPTPHPYGDYWFLTFSRSYDGVQVVESSPLGDGSGARLETASRINGHTAQVLLGVVEPSFADPDHDSRPPWTAWNSAHVDGPSAGVIVTLALVDAWTPGDLTGGIEVSGTGQIMSMGQVSAVGYVEAKFAAAQVAGAQVFFTPDAPEVSEIDPLGPVPWPGPVAEMPIREAFGLDTYRAWGAADVGRDQIRVVVINDMRQALAYLCGRGSAPACEVLAADPVHTLAEARPLHFAGGAELVSAPAVGVGPR